MSSHYTHWPHSPPHLFLPNTMYMVTASTLYGRHLFRGHQRLHLLQDALLEATAAYDWPLQAWAVFSNHYHFVAKSPQDGHTLKRLVQRLHSQSGRLLNRLEGQAGRQVWHQYWDTCLTDKRSYYARLRYVQHNPVKHGLVAEADRYPFCSAGWFKALASPTLQEEVSNQDGAAPAVEDDFLPLLE